MEETIWPMSLHIYKHKIRNQIYPSIPIYLCGWMRDLPVEIGVGGTFNVQIPSADVIDGFVIDHEGAVGVLKSRVGGQDRVVGLHDGRRDLGSWVDGKLQFGLLSIVDGEAFHQEGGESRSSTATERVEDQESLKSGTLIGQLSDPVENQVHNLLSYCVMTSGVVVGGVFLSGNQLFGVEELSVSSGSDLVCNIQIVIY